MRTTFNALADKISEASNAATLAKKTADAAKTQADKAFRKAAGSRQLTKGTCEGQWRGVGRSHFKFQIRSQRCERI